MAYSQLMKLDHWQCQSAPHLAFLVCQRVIRAPEIDEKEQFSEVVSVSMVV